MSSAPPRRDFSHARLRSHLEAWVLAHAPEGHQVRSRKQRHIGAMRGTVVELGPGPGTNMRYYADGVKVIAVEPNPVMHHHLREAADEHDVDLEIRTIHGEDVHIGDGEADGVVGTLVLCSVDDPPAVLDQVTRMLKPGGTYFFYEHVVAPEGSWTRRIQRLIRRPHAWVANGCRVDQDTAGLLQTAGFAEIDIDELDGGLAMGWTRHTIIGHAVR